MSRGGVRSDTLILLGALSIVILLVLAGLCGFRTGAGVWFVYASRFVTVVYWCLIVVLVALCGRELGRARRTRKEGRDSEV
jgi:hypothetical protein